MFDEPLRSLARRSPSSHLVPSLSRSRLTDLVPRPFFLQHERTTCCSRAHLRRACVRPLLPCATRAARVLRTKVSSFLSVLSLFGLLLSITAIDASRSRSPSRHPALARGARSPPSLLRPDRSFSLAFLVRSPARAARAPRKARTPSFRSSACSIPRLAHGATAPLRDFYNVLHLRFPFSFSPFHVLSSSLPLHSSVLFLRLFPACALLFFSVARALEEISYFFPLS